MFASTGTEDVPRDADAAWHKNVITRCGHHKEFSEQDVMSPACLGLAGNTTTA